MDKVIVTGLLVVGSVTAALVVMLALLPVISSSSSAVIESQSEAADRIRTDIEIIAVSGNITGDRIHAWVKNVGTFSILAIERSDVFLVRSTDPGNRFDSIAYATTTTDNDVSKTWTGDRKERGLSWERGDTLLVQIELRGSDLLGTGDHALRFSTPNGITAEKTFEKSGS